MNHRSIFILTVSAVCLFGGLRACLGAEDAYAGLLKTHYPHGVHKLRTNTNDSSIVWQSETLDNNQVNRETRTYPTLNDLNSNLMTRALDKSAYIEIAGMWDHASAPDTDAKQNEALLLALRGKGYEEAHFANLKKYYGPDGHHFIDAMRGDGTILWTSSVIQGDRIIHTKREFGSLDEFKKNFLAAKMNKAVAVEVHSRGGVKRAGATTLAESVLNFLRQEGYEKAGGISN